MRIIRGSQKVVQMFWQMKLQIGKFSAYVTVATSHEFPLINQCRLSYLQFCMPVTLPASYIGADKLAD